MVDEEFEKLKEILEPYKNTIVIADYFKLAKLVDVQKGYLDTYWVYDYWDDGIKKATCVGKWIPLKGHIPDEEYNTILKRWNMNNEEKAI